MERHIWTVHPYVAYTMVDKLINPLTLLAGPCFVSYLMYKSTIPVAQGGYHLPWWNILLSYFVWLLSTRTAKLLPHLWNRPQDIIYVPAFIVFGYYFALMKIYALCTLHETGWGTRAGIGDPTLATKAAAANVSNEKLASPDQESKETPQSSVVSAPLYQQFSRQQPLYDDQTKIRRNNSNNNTPYNRHVRHEQRPVEMQTGYRT